VFNEKNIIPVKVVEARKQKIHDDEAWNILSSADEIVVGRGKKFQILKPSEENKEKILKVCLGRTGNLRAPSLKIGNRMIVGFNEDMYAQFVE